MSDEINNWTWKTRWVMRRNAILASPAFQRWACRTPFIRGVARRRAAAQFDLVAGFVYSQILSAFVHAGLIAFLNGHLRRLDDISAFAGMSKHAADRLLRAGQALQITESPQSGWWTLGEAGASLSANPGAMAMIRHHNLLYADLVDPLALLAQDRRVETALSAYWTYASKGQAKSDTGYSALMAATQPMVSQQITDAYNFSAHDNLLDIGGGSGAFAHAVAAVAPKLRIGIFDLPEVIGQAKRGFAGQDRFALHGGSFKESEIPKGYDLITLVRILHDHDDDVVKALLAKIYQALPDGGSLLVVEPFAGSKSALPMGDAYFGVYLWAMGSGRPRRHDEINTMLCDAGFARIKRVKTALPIITSALVARK